MLVAGSIWLGGVNVVVVTVVLQPLAVGLWTLRATFVLGLDVHINGHIPFLLLMCQQFNAS